MGIDAILVIILFWGGIIGFYTHSYIEGKKSRNLEQDLSNEKVALYRILSRYIKYEVGFIGDEIDKSKRFECRRAWKAWVDQTIHYKKFRNTKYDEGLFNAYYNDLINGGVKYYTGIKLRDRIKECQFAQRYPFHVGLKLVLYKDEERPPYFK